MSNKFSQESHYISNTFTRESPQLQTGFHVSERSPRHSNQLYGEIVKSGDPSILSLNSSVGGRMERWGAGVETQKNVWGEIGGWGRVPFNETYAPSLSTIYDGA